MIIPRNSAARSVISSFPVLWAVSLMVKRCIFTPLQISRAFSSVAERFVHIEEVAGSIPAMPKFVTGQVAESTGSNPVPPSL